MDLAGTQGIAGAIQDYEQYRPDYTDDITGDEQARFSQQDLDAWAAERQRQEDELNVAYGDFATMSVAQRGEQLAAERQRQEDELNVAYGDFATMSVAQRGEQLAAERQRQEDELNVAYGDFATMSVAQRGEQLGLAEGPQPVPVGPDGFALPFVDTGDTTLNVSLTGATPEEFAKISQDEKRIGEELDKLIGDERNAPVGILRGLHLCRRIDRRKAGGGPRGCSQNHGKTG